MKITKQKLVEIIKEELEAALNEEEADCRHLFGKERADCIEQAKNREINRGLPANAEDLATVVGREMSGSLKSVKRKLDILDRIHSGEIKTVNLFRTALEAAKNAESLEAYFNAEDEEKRQRAEDAMSQAVEELPYDASNADLDKRALELLKTSKGGLEPKPNKDGIDF